jgi:small GTP-binding protein
MVIKKKIVLLGDSAVGKTSLIRKYVFNQLEASYDATVGSKLSIKKLKIRGLNKTENLKLMIWDLIGTKGYRALHARTFVGVHGAILVSDLSRRETLDSLDSYWIPTLFEVNGNVPLVFVCNKSDLKGRFEFEFDDMVNLSEKYNCDFDEYHPSDLEYNFSTSIKGGNETREAFESMGNLVLCNNESEDPLEELYGNLVATGICKYTKKTTPIGTLDAIMVDFCQGFKDTRMAMILLRQEITKAGIDINNPTKWRICKVIEYLAEAENEFLDEETVAANLERRLSWAYKIKEIKYHHDGKDDFETLRPSI